MDKERERRPDRLTLEDATRIAREITLELGEHPPTIIAEGSMRSVRGEFATIPDVFADRVHMMRSAGFAFGQSGEVGELQQVFFISEGWMSVADKDTPAEMRPSQDPKRKEVLLITNLVINERQTRFVILEMMRDAEGRLTDLRDLEFDEEREASRKGESPLLDAFVKGFRLGSGRLN